MQVDSRLPQTRSRRGAATVEVAVLLAFILVPTVVGIWEVGRLIEVQQHLTNAAREGARQASTGQRSISQIQQTVVNYLANNGITVPASSVTVTNLTSSARYDPTAGTQPQNAQQLDHFQIAVSVPFDSVRWVLLSKISNVTTVNATADWYSMNNIPLTVSQTIPGTPQ
jgi:Flp pilus assembly protein TadG